MQNLSKFLLLSATLSFITAEANTTEITAIKPTSKVVLLDGHCGGDEWEAATKIDLPAQASINLIHDKDSFYICAKGIEGDTTVLDLYIEHTETGYLHKFHLSAQMGEQVRTDKGWSKSGTWKLEDWTGFWVPYFGNEDTEDGKRPKFFRGLHRQVQILRKKFPGNTWNIMFGVHIKRDGKWTEYLYPAKAVENDNSTWAKFSFSE
ncbi:hypothetical protein [Microbulbifer sp. GL-2]|uniref:hypothetical protein n=1 Tax=Microbulbifer sp. GL-2 TaxID=2591606 RepID=UPI00116216FB|nr:hypothetical protein [Microbulbifer sp. GL-2]BBM04125.1 hypothetical protein GL2_41990 [Microbulbifer sp. GL-2]